MKSVKYSKSFTRVELDFRIIKIIINILLSYVTALCRFYIQSEKIQEKIV